MNTRKSKSIKTKTMTKMNLDQKRRIVKDRILHKFGSVNAFANHRKQELNSWTIVRTLDGSRKKDQDRFLTIIAEGCEFLKPEKEIQDSTRQFIRRTVVNEFGSFAAFNRDFPQYSKSFLSNVINGSKKLFDDKTRDLLALLFEIHEKQRRQ